MRLRFVHDGGSAEPSTLDRRVFQPETYGDRWAPVLVAWETEEQNPEHQQPEKDGNPFEK